MSDHHDFGDHHDDEHYDGHHGESSPYEELPPADEPHFADEHPGWADEHPGWADEHPGWADDDHEHPVFDEHPEPEAGDHHELTAGDDEPGPVGHTDDLPPAEDPVDVFPPPVDVGPLPEPVDGFPWIDTGSLGVVDPAAAHHSADPVRPEDLAGYNGTELPPGQDPWAVLVDSEDPATSALARWWQQQN